MRSKFRTLPHAEGLPSDLYMQSLCQSEILPLPFTKFAMDNMTGYIQFEKVETGKLDLTVRDPVRVR